MLKPPCVLGSLPNNLRRVMHSADSKRRNASPSVVRQFSTPGGALLLRTLSLCRSQPLTYPRQTTSAPRYPRTTFNALSQQDTHNIRQRPRHPRTRLDKSLPVLLQQSLCLWSQGHRHCAFTLASFCFTHAFTIARDTCIASGKSVFMFTCIPC
jgi:hypothetical protein